MATGRFGAAVQGLNVSLAEVLLGAGIVVVLVVGTAWQTYLLVSRRRMDRALQRSERRFRLLAENGADMIWLYDEDFRSVYVSPASERVLGYRPEELIGSALADLVHPDDIQLVREGRERFAGQGFVTVTARFRHRDGHWVWLEATGMRIETEHPDAARIQMVAPDVSERVATHRELVAEQERSQLIISSASDPYLSVDRFGTALSWNRSAERTFGWSRDEILGQKALSILGTPQQQPGNDRILRALTGGDAAAVPRPFEQDVRHRDGRLIPVEVTLWTTGEGDRVTVNAILRDISTRRETERELTVARERALEASRLKSEFLATVSHEIRTPMNGVIGLSGLLLDSPLAPNQRRFAEGIGTAAASLLGVINDILDFSKLEAGRVVLDEVDFTPAQLVAGVVDLMAEPAQAKGLRLMGSTDPFLVSPLRGDAGRLRQVLINLTANAIKFTDAGEVVVRFDRAARGSAPSGWEATQISVRDTGIGIPVEAQARMFDPFAQSDSSASRSRGGSGLGLTICRQIVEAMGGRIGVNSEPDRGSTFWCDVPLRRGQGRAGSMRTLDGLQVLIVDDNDSNRTLLRSQTQGWQMTPRTAGSGAEALDLLRDAARHGRPCDLAILDQMMPGMDGLELAERISRDADIPFVHMILLTSDSTVDLSVARAAGVSACLTKPVQRAQLYESIATMVAADAGGHQPISPVPVPLSSSAGAAEPYTDGSDVRPRRLMVAEDNEINQQVVVGLLKPLGYQVDLAGDGVEAVRLAGQRRYDAVLMDCQMPTVDGYEATTRLRRGDTQNREVPVIALTASARAEDRDRCLAAGMSDYLAKPVTRASLVAVLDRWVGRSGSRESEEPVASPAAASPDAMAIAARLAEISGGDEDAAPLVRRLAESFLRRVPGELDRLDVAVGGGAGEEVVAQAHRLKGTAANLGAVTLAERCGSLEAAARAGDLDRGDELVRQARRGFADAEAVLRTRLEQDAGAAQPGLAEGGEDGQG